MGAKTGADGVTEIDITEVVQACVRRRREERLDHIVYGAVGKALDELSDEELVGDVEAIRRDVREQMEQAIKRRKGAREDGNE